MAREVMMRVGLSLRSLLLNDSADEKIWLGTELGWTIEEDGIFA